MFLGLAGLNPGAGSQAGNPGWPELPGCDEFAAPIPFSGRLT